MESKEYNGWSNYATWRVNLEIIDGFDWDETEQRFSDLRDLTGYIKDTVETCVFSDTDISKRSLVSDYADAFLQDVNYHEIAEKVAENYPNLIKIA